MESSTESLWDEAANIAALQQQLPALAVKAKAAAFANLSTDVSIQLTSQITSCCERLKYLMCPSTHAAQQLNELLPHLAELSMLFMRAVSRRGDSAISRLSAAQQAAYAMAMRTASSALSITTSSCARLAGCANLPTGKWRAVCWGVRLVRLPQQQRLACQHCLDLLHVSCPCLYPPQSD